MQANLRHILIKITEIEFSLISINHAQKQKQKQKKRMSLNGPTGNDCIPSVIQIDKDICKKIRAEVSALLYYNSDLGIKLYSLVLCIITSSLKEISL